MNEKRAREVVLAKKRDKMIAAVLLGAMQQPFRVRLRLAWAIVKGARRESR